MKKLFFFRSAASGGETNQSSPTLTDKQIYGERPSRCIDKSRSKRQVSEDQAFGTNPCLRRSLSFSSGGIYDGQFGQRNLNDQSGSSGSYSNSLLQHPSFHSSRCQTLTPERQHRRTTSGVTTEQNVQRTEKACLINYCRDVYSDSSESSSYSSDDSNKVLDLYIDGEHPQEKSKPRSSFPVRYTENGKGCRKHPPGVHHEDIYSQTVGVKQKPKSQSFREQDALQLKFSSKCLVENGFGNGSPRKIAKSVVDRLSQSRFSSKVHSKECDPEIPITIEDIYNGKLSKCPSVYSDEVSQTSFMNEPIETIDDCHHVELLGLSERNSFDTDDQSGIMNNTRAVEDTDANIFRKLKEVEEQAMSFSEDLEQGKFFRERGVSVPALIQKVRSLAEDKVNLSCEILNLLQEWTASRASTKEELRSAWTERDAQIQRLEKEKNELQSSLEKELDRRSSEWTLKLEKYQAEEHRLRERVRELAEQNVSLQREIFSCNEREWDSRNRISDSEQQLQGLAASSEELKDENKVLQQNMFELQEKYRAVKEERDCIYRNYEEKVKECKDLHRSITRLQRTCSEQEKTIDGLRELCEGTGNKTSLDNQLGRLQSEQMRLTSVEQGLRKEVESYRLEADSLRQENINLLHRLTGTGKKGGSSIFRLDQELGNRLYFLQNQGLSLLVDTTQLCGKLFDQIKRSGSRNTKDGQANEYVGLDGQFVIECEVKLQGFKRGIENMTRSLQAVSTVLFEKCKNLNEKSGSTETQPQSCRPEDDQHQIDNKTSENVIESELKAEILLTNLLREKLYSKELDVEQLQAELAAAVRGNDVLKCEVQNALDTISCLTHRMKDIELQLIKKDENINQLESDLQESLKELTIVRGILPKVSEERDMMWKEVKQYSEKNMLLNSELNFLKKKIEALDEDILLKEGQITILKDTVGKPFDLLASPDSTHEFLLE